MGWLRRGRSRDVVVVRDKSPLTTRPAETTVRDEARSSVPEPVRLASDWSWRAIVIVVAAAVLVAGVVWLKTVVVPVLVATLLASLLAPFTHWLRNRLRFPRALAVLTTLIAMIAVLVGLVTLAGSSIVDGFPALRDRAIAGVEDALEWLSAGPLNLDEETISTWVDQLQDQLSANADTIISGALSFTSSAGHVAAGALIALFCLFFFLLDGRSIWTWVVRLFPRAARERVDGAGLRSWVSLGSYARTQILVAFVDGIGIGLAAWLLGVPLPIPLGILVFVGAFIPIIGALVSGSVAVAVALVDGGVLTAVLMLVAVLVVQQVEGNLLQPLLMSHALKLHPVAVLLAVSTGTLVGGIVGALFAVPIIAVANTAIKYLNGKDALPDRLKGDFEELMSRWQES